jgi:hypothetical protein
MAGHTRTNRTGLIALIKLFRRHGPCRCRRLKTKKTLLHSGDIFFVKYCPRCGQPKEWWRETQNAGQN